MITKLVIATIVLGAQLASARPPPDDRESDLEHVSSWKEQRAFFEWSTWIRLGYGVERETPDTIARTITPPSADQQTAFDAALGVDVTFPIPTSRVRLGPWMEIRGLDLATGADLFGGVELLIAGRPADMDMFFFNGEGIWSLRGGASSTHATGAIAFGYRCPWKLWGPWNESTRYMIGARIVASASRALANPDDWSMSLGLEFEPVGALRYVSGIKSWY